MAPFSEATGEPFGGLCRGAFLNKWQPKPERLRATALWIEPSTALDYSVGARIKSSFPLFAFVYLKGVIVI